MFFEFSMRKSGKIVGLRGSFGVEDLLRVIFLKLCVKIRESRLWLLLMISKKWINIGFSVKLCLIKGWSQSSASVERGEIVNSKY